MKILVETYERPDGGYVAMASREGELVENGHVAANLSEAEAAARAVTLVVNADLNTLIEPQPTPRGLDSLTTIQTVLGENSNRFTLHFRYTDGEGERTYRNVRPHRLSDDGKYLYAYDVDNQAPRTFRVDRIEGAYAACFSKS